MAVGAEYGDIFDTGYDAVFPRGQGTEMMTLDIAGTQKSVETLEIEAAGATAQTMMSLRFCN